MPDRFDLGPLIQGLREGLRKRRPDGEEPTDRVAVGILLGVPALVLLVCVAFRIQFPAADQLLAACALLAGALLTAFAQIAGWRERILSRHRTIDGVDVRALNEAAAHVLVSLLVSVVASTSLFVLANLDLGECAPLAVDITAVALSGLSASFFTYIALSLVIVANLLWDALCNEQRETIREGLSGQGDDPP